MRLQGLESKDGPPLAEGSKQSPDKPYNHFVSHSSSLPFGQNLRLSDVAGPTYLTAQTLVQQVAYTLSDRLWTYSPETFDLDAAVKHWCREGSLNARGLVPNVESMQIRSGAASIALGYIFSKDFDLTKRYVPQSILASSSGLQYLQTALDQLSLLYSVASPLVAHIAAIDYVGGCKSALVTDYTSALGLAEELGLAVVSSFTPHESQHMALFATLLASIVPSLHIYDGVKVGRETTRIIDVMDQQGLARNYEAILKASSSADDKRVSLDARVGNLFRAFNNELGTDYGLFEYQGHSDAEVALVTFGTVESSIASQIVRSLRTSGARVGVVNVRVYRPFVEAEFLKVVPKSVKRVAVLGQVRNALAVADPSIHSYLYSDVLAAFTFGPDWSELPVVLDIKYPREQAWTPIAMTAALQLMLPKPLLPDEDATLQILHPQDIQQYTFWILDDSVSRDASAVLGQALSKDSSSNVTISTKHDNSIQGGVQRTDIRKSKHTIDAPYSVDAAEIVYIDDEVLLKEINVLSALKTGGKVLLRLPSVKDDDLEKKLPPSFRKGLCDKAAQLYVLDPQAVEKVFNDEGLESTLVQVAWLRTALPSLEGTGIQKLSALGANAELLQGLSQDLTNALRRVEVPEDWAKIEEGAEVPVLPVDFDTNSFVPFEKSEAEAPTLLRTWHAAAKALAFKEAFATEPSLRPDQSTQTWQVTLKEHRRLTPSTYDRNIMHLEFDIGDSGLQYNIGDSLGIHPRNDEQEIQTFVRDYGLDPDAIVETQNKEDPEMVQASTAYQALVEQVDIFGRPGRQFYEQLAEFATDPAERKALLTITKLEGTSEFKRRAEVDTLTYADVLEEFPSARPSFHDLIRIVAPMKRREYSIASCQKAQPDVVALMIVTVSWVNPKGKDRFGLATRYLNALPVGARVTVSLKPSVMKLPPRATDPIIMAGLGTGLAPFRAFVQHRAHEKAQGKEIGPVLLYMGSRRRREEYCYGEEWEAYRDAGVLTLLSCAFSRDQPQKIYIQDRMRQTLGDIVSAYIRRPGAFYLCGPTWPVPDVTAVLEEAIGSHAKDQGRKVNTRTELEKLKEESRYVLEVY